MFTLSQITAAHSKVKQGADFPNYIQDLIKIGVAKYAVYVADGHGEYFGKENFELQSPAKYAALAVANEYNLTNFKKYLKLHQQGETDYMTFCQHAAECGIVKWVVNTIEMTCTYIDQQGNEILIENIPS